MNLISVSKSLRTMLLGGIAMTAAVGWTQVPESSTPKPTSPAPAESSAAAQTPDIVINETKIDQFADAYIAVQKIQANAASSLETAGDDPAKQRQAQDEVEKDMIEAVERTGLKLDEFNGIVQTMTADAGLRARVVAKVRERMRG